MIRQEVLKELIPITDEEEKILNGNGEIDKSLYMNDDESIVDYHKFLKDGKLIDVRPQVRFAHFPKHTHNYVELVYMCAGSATHIVNDETVVLSEGDLLFLSQNAEQEVLPTGGNDISVNFIILPSFFDRTLKILGNDDSPLRRFIVDCLKGGDYSQSYLHFKVNDILSIQNLMENLIWNLTNNEADNQNINQTTMGLLFLQLTNHTDRVVYRNSEQGAVMEVLRYIETHYRDGSLSDLAVQLHYDFSWLSREIKRVTGENYTDLVQKKRLSQSAFLLKNTDMNISEIAYQIGYNNVSYFHRLFKSCYGISPRKYRISTEQTDTLYKK